ncbi:MAG: fibronectin type III domain-containing protein [Ignavibacteria bacterium]|nr:fibronectin type III domain-containing protein [Ignavibacteria bacterium]
MIKSHKLLRNLILTTMNIIFISGYMFSQTINPPGDLEAEPEEFQYIKVKWDDNSNNEDGFYIERSLSPDTTVAWETIGQTFANSEQFLDYWVTNQVTYYYRAYAYAGNIRSPYSNIAFTVAQIDTGIIPRAPSDLLVDEITETSVSISWQDNSYNESGFIIARRQLGEIVFRYIDTVAADVLTYQEVGLTPDNTYFYKLCSYNAFGVSDFTNTVSARTKKNTSVINNISEIPDGFFVSENYPNPFNPVTKIKFGLLERSFVSLEIFNIMGKKMETLIDQDLSAGTYEIVWNAAGFASGVYFYRINVMVNNRKTEFSRYNKMILNK